MANKISEYKYREKKVKKLKKKILKEITEVRVDYSSFISAMYQNSKNGFFEIVNNYKDLINELSYLNSIEYYITKTNAFMSYSYYNDSLDTIIYVISDETIDLMLVSDFNFVNRIFTILKTNNTTIDTILNDTYISYKLISTFEEIILRDKLKTK